MKIQRLKINGDLVLNCSDIVDLAFPTAHLPYWSFIFPNADMILATGDVSFLWREEEMKKRLDTGSKV